MKACIIQPPYSQDVSRSDELFKYKMNQLDACNADTDIIVLPEYSDVPCATSTLEETLFYHDTYFNLLMDQCRKTACRCTALVFVNALSKEISGYRNTTFVIDRQGRIIGKYFKRHLPPFERDVLRLDGDYTMSYSEPYVIDIEGIRFGFLTCYDFYFYEAFGQIARQNVDVIIGCSLQRSDTHDAIEIICRNLAYNANAYVLRSSVSFSEDSNVCGASMAVTPTGRVLVNMRGRFGREEVEFDPRDKYLKPAGFGNPDAPHWKYIEYGRKPWQYRNGGSAMVPGDNEMKYPRICAHRGFSTIAPENSMPAFGAAIALGAQEIEFDLWPSSDGEIVSCPDVTLDRVSNGMGKIYEHTYEELSCLDFGFKFGKKFKGLSIIKFEDILRKFAGQVIMNVHVKSLDGSYDHEIMRKIVANIRKYDCANHVYFMLELDNDICTFRNHAPDINVCVGHDKNRPWALVDRAIELGAQKIQLFKPYFNQKMIDKAKAYGIICNMFYADDPNEARHYLDMGVDTVLTNEYCIVSQVLK